MNYMRLLVYFEFWYSSLLHRRMHALKGFLNMSDTHRSHTSQSHMSRGTQQLPKIYQLEDPIWKLEATCSVFLVVSVFL